MIHFAVVSVKWNKTNGRKVNLRGEETVDNFKKIGKKIVDFLGVFIPNITFFGNFPYLYGNNRIQIFFQNPCNMEL